MLGSLVTADPVESTDPAGLNKDPTDPVDSTDPAVIRELRLVEGGG